MREAVIVDACRSPIGRAGDRGVFRTLDARDLMIPVAKAIVKRNNLDPAKIDDVILGSAGTRAGTRMINIFAGFPLSVPATTVERACASSTQAIAMGARAIECNDADIILALGLETQNRQGPVDPASIGRRGAASRGGGMPAGMMPQAPKPEDYPPGWKFSKNYPMLPPGVPPWVANMGMTAEELATRFNIPRADMDAFSVTSHQKYFAADEAGYFKDEIIPITINYTDGTSEVIEKDQCPRRETSLEKLSSLPPSFKEGGLITAGNSCPQNDGAGAVLLMSKEKAKELGYKPLCTFRHALAVGVEPAIMGTGPVPSTQKLLARTGMKLSDFDMLEVNEAFACVVLYFIRELHCTPEDIAKINPLGGAIAIGHPLGMTGTRQMAVMARHLNRIKGRFGLLTLCVGGGQGMATIVERENY